jgi:hypothetical protein
MEDKLPIQLKLTIPAASMKKIVESGRTMEFVDTISSLAKIYVAEYLVNNLATAQQGMTFTKGFFDDDGFGNNSGTPVIHLPPKGPGPGPWTPGRYEEFFKEFTTQKAVKEALTASAMSQTAKAH